VGEEAELVREPHFRNKVVNDVIPTLQGRISAKARIKLLSGIECFCLNDGSFFVRYPKGAFLLNEQEWYRGEAKSPSSLAEYLQ
jgi:hypothetical protein